ncbi:hypothetical protein MHBO_004418 [Bonamia ostreae]|uniref:Uncharacterized protein n=1 Tax=Bonamia ostreae TaxID=126728 RepID=A0ABV2ATR8_9EUKA
MMFFFIWMLPTTILMICSIKKSILITIALALIALAQLLYGIGAYVDFIEYCGGVIGMLGGLIFFYIGVALFTNENFKKEILPTFGTKE